MGLYVVLFLAMLPFVCLELGSVNPKHQRLFHVFIIVFLFLSFLRWETGTDWDSYLRIFNNISEPFDTLEEPEANTEKGYMFLNNLAKFLSSSYTMMLFLEGLIIYIYLYKGIRWLSPYPLFSLFIFFCMNLGGIFFVRQTIAVVITLFSIKYIIQRRLWMFLLMIILASTFHRTAVIFVFTYFVFYRRYSFLTSFLLLLGSAILGYIIGSALMDYLSSAGLSGISERIAMYSGADYNDALGMSSTAFMIRGLINRFFIFTLVFLFMRAFRNEDDVFNGIFNLYLFGACLFVFVTPISREFARLTGYYDIVQILIYPYLLFILHGSRKRILFLLLIFFFVFRLYSAVNQWYDAYVPYKTVLDI